MQYAGNSANSAHIKPTIWFLAAGFAGAIMFTGIMLLIAPRPAHALPKFAAQTGLACGKCHVNPAGGGPRNAFGKAFQANGFKLPKEPKEKENKKK